MRKSIGVCDKCRQKKVIELYWEDHWCSDCIQEKEESLNRQTTRKVCLTPDWEGGLEKGEHSFDKDGFCNNCGKKKEV